MINFRYYFVDVGENYCYIDENNGIINLRDAIINKDKEQLKIAKEIIKHNFKMKYLHESSQEFKMVYVNKADKLYIDTEVSTIGNAREIIEPLVSEQNYDLYLMSPGQNLCVRCMVRENEEEIRNLSYSSIRKPIKAKRYSKY